MAVYSAPRTVTVTTSPTLISDNNSYVRNRKINNTGGATIFLGGSNVSASGANKGFPVAAGASEDLFGGQAVYGIIAAATADVIVWENSF
jgi:hypothetical protein